MMKCLKTLFLVFVFLLFGGEMALCQDDTVGLQAQQTSPRSVELSWQVNNGTTSVFRRYTDEQERRLIATVNGTSFTDRHRRAVCGDTVYYSISQTAAGVNHVGFAALAVHDYAPTAPAEWGVVTVDIASQQIELHWQASADTDIMGYLICEGTPSIAIDTVFGRQQTSYVFSGAIDEVHLFRICAFDSCHQASALTESCNNMVLLLTGEYCNRSVNATWNAYPHMPSGVGNYELWVSEDGGSFRRQSLVGGEDNTSVSFTVGEACQQVSAYVKAISVNGQYEALSEVATMQFGTGERPAYLYLRKVSVTDNGSAIHIVGQTDPTFNATTDYKIYRTAPGGATTMAGVCSPSADGTLEWWDMNVHPGEGVYCYSIGVMDGCGRNEILTRKGCTLLPRIVEQGEMIQVQWNAYEGWEGSTGYQLYVSPLGEEDWQLAASTMECAVDAVSNGGMGRCRYKVVAVEGGDSRYGRNDSLQSPSVFHQAQTHIWMPNAFTPTENTNNRVQPRFVYVNPKDYSFSVYNRMGFLVFTTTDTEGYWDGTSHGQMQPSGAYLYKITYTQNDGTFHEKIGTILLIQ